MNGSKRYPSIGRREALASMVGGIFLPATERETGPAVHVHAGSQEGPPSQDEAVGRLNRPWAVGRPRNRPTPYDNDPFVIAIEERIKCTCGCSHSLYQCRTTDFNCSFWQERHAEVIAMVEQRLTAEEIIERYVANHGEIYRMAPPARGFDLAGYLVPGTLIALVGGVLLWTLRRRAALAPAPAATVLSDTSLSDGEAARLRAELDQLIDD